MNEKELEKKFDELLKEDLVNVGDDFYHMEILYADPEQLMDNFSYLEDQNLKNIGKTQEIEQSIELINQKEILTKNQIGTEIENQEQVKKDLELQILNAKLTLQDLKR